MHAYPEDGETIGNLAEINTLPIGQSPVNPAAFETTVFHVLALQPTLSLLANGVAVIHPGGSMNANRRLRSSLTSFEGRYIGKHRLSIQN